MYLSIRKLLFLALFFLHANLLCANDYYWVGGSGNWATIGKWATTSGGNVFYSTIPGIGDNVYFDDKSFSQDGQMVNIDSHNATCANMVWTGSRPTCGLSGNNTLQINNSLTLVKNMKFGFSGIIEFTDRKSVV